MPKDGYEERKCSMPKKLATRRRISVLPPAHLARAPAEDIDRVVEPINNEEYSMLGHMVMQEDSNKITTWVRRCSTGFQEIRTT